MSKVLFYIYDDMADFEMTFLCHLLSVDCGVEISMVSDKLESVKSKAGIKYLPDMRLSDIRKDDVLGFVIPGGWIQSVSDELIMTIQELNAEDKLVAAICAAPYILAVAGILENRKYTTSIVTWANKHKKQFGIDDPFYRENFVNNRCCCDGNIITAKGIAFIDFAIEVCSYLNLFQNEKEKDQFRKDIIGL